MINKGSKKVFITVGVIAIAVIIVLLLLNFGGIIEKIQDSNAMREAKKSYKNYLSDNNISAAEFMIYESDGKFVALNNGEIVGLYESNEEVMDMFFGKAALTSYDITSTSVSGLSLCVMREKYSYPLDTLEPEGAIRYDSDLIKQTIYEINGDRFAAIIPLDDLDFNRVTIKNGSKDGIQNGNFSYTFLTSEPKDGEEVSYAKGYYCVVDVKPVQSLAINIPEDAAYLYVYHHTKSTEQYFFPEEIVFSHKVESDESFTLATWNIGNFSQGSSESKITSQQLKAAKACFTDFIENRLNADLICLNECDPEFTEDGNHKTEDVLFSEYTSYVGEEHGYQCNSMFYKPSLEMTTPKSHNYGNGYGYNVTDVTIGEKTVTVVSVHLNYDHDYKKDFPSDWVDEINKEQIMDLLDKFSDKEHVILLGDWNNIRFGQYNFLSDAGFTLAYTDPALQTKMIGGAYDNRSLDNIAYKGVTISNFTCEFTALSDHHALTCTVTID